jgi:SAM-dependent methyltransferase
MVANTLSNGIDEARRESAYFDRMIGEEGDFNPYAPRGWRTLARRFSEMVPLPAGLRLLDIGCGTGRSRQIYADKAAEFTGMDLSSAALRIASARFPRDVWLQGNACDIPFPDGAFDAVCFSSVLHHIDDFARAVSEGQRVVRPGGYVFAFDPNLFHPAMALFRCPSSWFYSSKGVSPNERPLRPVVLREAFTRCGLTVRQRCQADIPYREVAPPLLNALLGIYNTADRLLELSGLGRWFGSFVITVGKKPDPSHRIISKRIASFGPIATAGKPPELSRAAEAMPAPMRQLAASHEP